MDDGRNSTGRDATEGSKHELDVPAIPPGELQYLQDRNHQTQENLKMQSHTDLSSLFDTYKSSVLNKDVDALMSIYGHDFVAFDMWGAWCHVGDGPWREVIQKWLGSLGSGTVVIEFDDINIIPGDDVSAAHATVTYRGLSDTGDTAVDAESPDVDRKTDGWHLEDCPSAYLCADRARHDDSQAPSLTADRVSEPQRGGNSLNCGTSSVIACQFAFDPTKIWADARMVGSSTSVPMAMCT